MHRRTLLRAGLAGTATVGLAGCLDSLFGDGQRVPSPLENPPNGAYIPTHVDDTAMIGMTETETYGLAVMYTFPHLFWLLTGEDVREVEIEDGDDVHLMMIVWDREYDLVVPSASVSVLAADAAGEPVADRPMWTMLSQPMGLHYGDNLGFGGAGTYDLELTVAPPDVRLAGGLADRDPTPESTTLSFDFDPDALDDLGWETFDAAGDRDAIEPQSMGRVPDGRLPAASELPGELIGEGRSGDAHFVVTRRAGPPAGIDDDGEYVAVSMRTPHNRYPLGLASLGLTQYRDGTQVADRRCRATLTPDAHLHYGCSVADLHPGDELEVRIDTPPQLARHEGYESAFIEMDAVTVPVG